MPHVLQENLALLKALEHFFPESSKRSFLQWIKWGRVLVDGTAQTEVNSLVKAGQTITLKRKESTKIVMGLPILYEDRWLVVIDKPAGLLSVPAEKEEANALHLLKAGLKSLSLLPVHRLDQDTSGVLVFARSKIAEEKLAILFENHTIEREYVAVVEGLLPYSEGVWENYLREKENYSVEVTTKELGRKAITHYQVAHRSKKLSFVRLKLETGRKHQIRVQAAHAGYPIVGDKRYGSLINPFKRLCLHARTLAFIHPFTKKHVTFSSSSQFLPSFTRFFE